MELAAALRILVPIAVYVTAIWLLSLRLKDSGIMDIFWGPGFLLAAGTAAILQPGGADPRVTVVITLVTLWAGRLALHIGRRNWGHQEDARYAKWRADWGDSWWWVSWFKVFALQGLVMWLVSFPLLLAVTSSRPTSLTLWDFAGIVLWLAGFAIETVSDAQLSAFRRSGKKGVLDTGLWRYSRHPNYFGESVLWLGYACFALAVPGGWMTLFGPILMIWLIIRVSGVRMLDDLLAETKPGYAEYMERTSGFVPLPPRTSDVTRD